METKFKRVPAEIPVSQLTPLNISCTSTKCDENLHCFKTGVRAAKKFGTAGVCKECGANLIDWQRIHLNDTTDSKFVFKSMKAELIRHVYWHTKIEDEAISSAIQKGNEGIRNHARKLLKSRIAKSQNVWDGRQTPMTGGDIVNYAQHATATCCRKCLQYWHNIQPDIDLDEGKLQFCLDLVMLFVEERIPEVRITNT